MNKKEKLLMALKELRTFLIIYNWALSIGVIVAFIPIWKELNSTFYILITILGAITALETICFIILIPKMIKTKIRCNKFCTSLADAINEFNKVHRMRYEYYLAGDTESAKQCTECIQKNISEIIECAEKMLQSYGFSQKQKEQIKNGVEELQYMLSNIQPKNRTL